MTYPPNPGNDPSGWSAPGGGWGAPSDPGYTQPPSQPPAPSPANYPAQHPGQHPGRHPGYGGPATPPPPQIRPQPGIIPLQPLTMGQIYDGALKAIRANPVVMFIFAGILVTASTILQLTLASQLLQNAFIAIDQLDNPTSAGQSQLAGSIINSIPAALIGLALSFIISVILTGILTYAVSQAVLGFKPTPAQVWDSAKGRILPLILLTILLALLVLLPMGAMVALVIVASTTFEVGIGATILLTLGVIGLAVLWALAILPMSTLATPALMLEGASALTAIRRGWALSKPYFWRILGIYLLTSLLTGVISSFITTPASFVSVVLPPIWGLVAQGVAAVIASTLVTPFVAAVATLLYIDVRIRREGLAMELAAASA